MKLFYFAWVRQRLGRSEERIALPPDVTTVRELADWLRTRDGAYAAVFSEEKKLRVAVNQDHAGWDATVTDNDEVAFFPPVTGG